MKFSLPRAFEFFKDNWIIFFLRRKMLIFFTVFQDIENKIVWH